MIYFQWSISRSLTCHKRASWYEILPNQTMPTTTLVASDKGPIQNNPSPSKRSVYFKVASYHSALKQLQSLTQWNSFFLNVSFVHHDRLAVHSEVVFSSHRWLTTDHTVCWCCHLFSRPCHYGPFFLWWSLHSGTKYQKFIKCHL